MFKHSFFLSNTILAAVLTLTLASPRFSNAHWPIPPYQDFAEANELFNAGNYDKCHGYIADAIEDDAYGEQWHVLKLKTLLTLGRYPEALKALDAGIAEFENSIQLRWLGIEAALFNNDTTRARTLEEAIVDLSRRTWRYRDAENQITLARLDLSRNVDPKTVLDSRLSPLGKENPAALMAIAELALNKSDFALAATNYQQAAKLDPKNPDALFGIAKAFEPSDNEKTNAALNQALELNPNHIPSLLFVTERRVDEENYDAAKKLIEQIREINELQPQALAFAAVIAHLQNDSKNESQFRKLALSTWQGNPEIDYLIGKKLSQKYRFAEGSVYQRRALIYDKDFLPAKIQLTQDLLRLGKELEGWKLADEVYAADGYNILAHNLVTLRANITKFASLESDGFIIRMDPREATIYGDRVLELLSRAKKTLCEKYDIEISEPIVVEIFPKQQDFAIRTFGLPGGAGFLGVCFGSVITMNSPASQGESPSNWNSVLWHEFCHVVTLQKTNNKMPRWLSEGISVYEERRENPAWGDSMNRKYREMILGDDLTPVSKLSGAFLSPKSAEHLQFAYFESSLVVEYIVQEYGSKTLQKILVDLGIGLTINQALERYTGSIKLLDKEFADYAKTLAKKYAPDVNFEQPEMKPPLTIASLKKLVGDNPDNFVVLNQYAQLLIDAGKFEEAKTVVEELLQLHPQSALPYGLMARIARELADISLEKSSLEKYVAKTNDSFASELRLAEIAFEEKNWGETIKHANAAIAVTPLRPAPYRLLAHAGNQTKDPAIVADACRALLEMDPLDPAQSHFDYASALVQTNDLPKARLQILKSLEYAPRFRDAHKLLLQINKKIEQDTPASTEQPLPANKSDKTPTKTSSPTTIRNR